MVTTSEIYNTITPKRKKWWLILLILALICIIAIAIIIYLNRGDNVSFETINPTKGKITQSISATGTLSPTNEVQVGSQVSGTIYKLYVDVNDVVKKDQILAEINPNKLTQARDGYKAQLQSALANLEASKVTYEQKKWNYEQQEKLYKATGGKSPSLLELQNAKMEYLSAQSDIKVKQAAINQIQTNLQTSNIDIQNSIIRSPIDGIILERSVSLGQTVAASFQTPTLFTIAEDLKSMELVVNISESDIGKVKVGQEVSFSVDAYPHHDFSANVGKVNFASTTTDNITSYETTIYVNNDSLLLRPGMNATASINVASADDVLLVPVAAIFYKMRDKNESAKKQSAIKLGPPPGAPRREKVAASNNINSDSGTLWILENNMPKEIKVKIGITDSKMVEVESSELSLDSKVIIDSKQSN